MKSLKFVPAVMFTACLLSAHQSKSQTSVNVTQSIPLTIAKVTAPVSVTITPPATFTYYLAYVTEAEFDDSPTMTAAFTKMGVAGFEYVSTTSYLETSTGTMKFLLIFKKHN